MILEINNLSKKYGDKKALNKFSCKFTEGIYGLLGPNGAGKSTFMNILVDAIDRSSGEILYNGKETISMGKDYRNLIGYMPQQQGVYDSFTVAEFLDYIAGLKGLKKTEAKKRIETKSINCTGYIKWPKDSYFRWANGRTWPKGEN